MLDIGSAGSLAVGVTDGTVACAALALAIRPVGLNKINYPVALPAVQGDGRIGSSCGGLSSAHAASGE